jgi:hypothetical protein
MAIGVFVSASCRQQRAAQAGTLLLLLGFLGGIPLLAAGLASLTGNPSLIQSVLMASPVGVFEGARSYFTGSQWFWGSLAANQAIAWTLVGLAVRILTRTRLETIKNTSPGEALAGLETRRPSKTPLPRDTGEMELIQWLAGRTFRVRFLPWIGALLAVALVWVTYALGLTMAGPELGLVLLAVLHVGLKAAMAAHAVHAFAADRQSGALESILATPLSVNNILRGTARELRRRFVGPVLILSLATFWAAIAAFLFGSPVTAGVLAVATVVLPLDAHCLVWTGLFQGLAARNTAVALGTALLEVGILPWAWFVIARGIFWRSSGAELLLIWAGLWFCNQLWFLSNAKTQLIRNFRTLALKPYGAKNPRMESDWSPINWDDAVETAVP